MRGLLFSLESIYNFITVARGSHYQSSYNFKKKKKQYGKDFVSERQNCDAEGAAEKGIKKKQSLERLGSRLRRAC